MRWGIGVSQKTRQHVIAGCAVLSLTVLVVAVCLQLSPTPPSRGSLTGVPSPQKGLTLPERTGSDPGCFAVFAENRTPADARRREFLQNFQPDHAASLPLAARNTPGDPAQLPWVERIEESLCHPHVPHELVVQFAPETPHERIKQIVHYLGARALDTFTRGKLNAASNGWMHLALPETLCVRDALYRLQAEAHVLHAAEPNYIVQSLVVPNDADFSGLWAMNNSGQTGGTPNADIDAPEAWDLRTDASAIIVADIDTGVDYNHPDLAANMWKNLAESNGTTGVDDDGNGYVDDVYGWDFINGDNDPMDDNSHGTHTSGTIGGVGNNGTGVVGVAWNVRIMALKFLSSGGSGSLSDAVACIYYSINNGAHLSSNSWGGGGYSSAMVDAIAAADQAGDLFVAAAGNSSSDNDTSPMYPASYQNPNIISVAATDHNDALASFSSYGATTVDLGAPGVSILSTVPGASYASYSGTSMATPHVAGACALAWAQDLSETHLRLKDRILEGVTPLNSLSGKCVTGGRLNLYDSLLKGLVVTGDRLDDAAGNADGILNPGEQALLFVTVQNTGTTSRFSVTGILSTTDTAVSILSDTDFYGSLAPGASSENSNGFELLADLDVSTPRTVSFSLELQASSGENWTYSLELTIANSGRLYGTITDVLTGLPLADASVELTGPESATLTTDASGAYCSDPMPEGTYRVTASATGYFSRSAEASIPPDAQVDLALAPPLDLSGRLTKDGAAVSGALVRLLGSATEYSTSDSQGYYFFSGLQMGETYCVTPFRLHVAFSPPESNLVMPDHHVDNLDFQGADSQGAPGLYRRQEDPPLFIPSLDTVQSSLEVDANAPITELNVFVNLRHTWIGDLRLTLLSPSGTSVILHDYSGGSADDLLTWYDTETAPAESLDKLLGENAAGTWTLQIHDSYSLDEGELIEWLLEIYSSNLKLSGTVRDEASGAALPGVAVRLEGAASMNTATDAAGDYSFSNVGDGTYRIHPESTDFEFLPAFRQVVVSDCDQAGQDFVALPVSQTTVVRDESPDLGIPDNDPAGVTSNVNVADSFAISGLEVYVDIQHTWIGDLRVVLVTPWGEEFVLHDRSGGSADNLIGWYGTSGIAPVDSFDPLRGVGSNGTWSLRVEDHAGYDIGSLREWRLRFFFTRFEAELTAGLGKDSAGWIEAFDETSSGHAHLAWRRVPWSAYNSAGLGTRPARGDVDGDGYDEMVVGLDPYPASGGWIAVMDDTRSGAGLMCWLRIPWSAYNEWNGEANVAAGDLDGDGRAELVVGLGSVPEGYGGWLWIADDMVDDCRSLGWKRLPWSAYNQTGGFTRPACADVDGDGRAEVIVGLQAPKARGWLWLADDSQNSFAGLGWTRIPWSAYNASSGQGRPAGADVDGDGREEIVVGLDGATIAGGWFWVCEDFQASFAHRAWARIPWSAYNQNVGESRPCGAELDGDGRDEILVGLGPYPAAGGWFVCLDDAQDNYEKLGWVRVRWSSYNSTNGETLLSAGRLK